MEQAMRRGRARWCLALVFMLLANFVQAPTAEAAVTTFSNVTMNTTTPAMYDKFEMTFDLSATYTNPFDPDEVDVRATITTPSGEVEVVPGFYHSHTAPQWAVRYAARELGEHSVMLQVTDAEGIGQSSTYTFTAGPEGETRGYMGVTGERITDSFGKQITLLGSNYSWAAPDVIMEAMDKYEAQQMNVMRIWLSAWWSTYAAEWGPYDTKQQGIYMEYEGIGRYNLDNMSRMDSLMDHARDKNIYIMLTMNSFGDFWYNWDTHAYNIANGGPSYWTENDTDFWTNPVAIEYQQKLLRYMFARWGYSTSFGMLEYWNEADNRVNTYEHKDTWHAAMDSYWKDWDFYERPTTTSFAWMDHMEHNQMSWEELPMLDVTNFHYYVRDETGIDIWEEHLKHFRSEFGNRPAFVGESGYAPPGSLPDGDETTKRFMHDSLWAPLFRGGATGGNLVWVVDRDGFHVPEVYKEIYNTVAGFMKAEEYYLPAMPHVDYGVQANGTKVGAFKNSDRALLWINDPAANYEVDQPATISGMSFTLPGMNDGTYDVKYVDTTSGEAVQTTATSVGGDLLLSSIPAFQRDIAVKVVRQGSEAADSQAPTMPDALTSSGHFDTWVKLNWLASFDTIGVADYEIYRDGVMVGVSGGRTNYTDTGLTPETAYTYTVVAKDEAGNASSASSSFTITTEPVDSTAPTAPTQVTATAKSDVGVVLEWEAATDHVGVTGYDIYRDMTLLGSTDGETRTYLDTGLSAETAYSYTITAKDANANVSVHSDPLVVTTSATVSNFLQNGGFESFDGNSPLSWVCEQHYCSMESSITHGGSGSLKVAGSSNAWFSVYQSVPAAEGQSYTMDGYMNIPTNEGTTVNVKLRFMDEDGAVLSEQTVGSYSDTTSGWVHVTGEAVAPAGTDYARAHIQYAGLNATVYADDFSLKNTPVPVAPTKLVLDSSMVVNESDQGDASYLVDEQAVAGDPKAGSGGSPSTVWAAYNVPASVYLDLGSVYDLTDIYLRDVNNDGPLEIAIGSPGHWTTILTDPMEKYQSWKAHPVDVQTRYVRVTRLDGGANASELVLYGAPAGSDEIAPSAIGDVSVTSQSVDSVTLAWTATGDDLGAGTAASYEVRYSTAMITEADWTAVTPAVGTPMPSAAGSAETMTVSGLLPDTTYYFAVKAVDEEGNASELSNVAQAMTDPTPALITLDPTMVVNESGEGDAGYLVDEQATAGDPKNGTGGSPSTAWAAYNVPASAYIDLGQLYALSDVYIRDVNSDGPLEISVGSPGNWTSLFTDDMLKYQHWNAHQVDVQTQYIRVTRLDGGANASEILLYGLPVAP